MNGGSICVQAQNACGNSGSLCKSLKRTTALAPQPSAIIGPNSLCPGQCATYSIASVSQANSYNWVVSPGLNIISGQGTTTIYVCAATNYTGGYIRVSSVNCFGQTPGHRNLNMRRTSNPSTPSLSGSSGACKNGTYCFHAKSNGATSYNWIISGVTYTVVSGAGTSNFCVIFTSSGTAVVSVFGLNACGTSPVKIKNVNVGNCRLTDIGSTMTEVNAYPNPVKDLLHVSFSSEIQQTYSIQLVDMTGRVIFKESHTSSTNENQLELNVSGYSSGIYLLNFQMGDSREQIRVMIE